MHTSINFFTHDSHAYIEIKQIEILHMIFLTSSSGPTGKFGWGPVYLVYGLLNDIIPLSLTYKKMSNKSYNSIDFVIHVHRGGARVFA